MSLIPSGLAKSGVAEFYPKTIEQSLRFNDDDSAYLSWTPSYTGDLKTWTLSFWVKRSTISTNQTLFGTGTGLSGGGVAIWFNPSNEFSVYNLRNDYGEVKTTALYRDPSAWYHFVVTVDSTETTTEDRVKIYVNGEQITDFSSSNGYPNLNASTRANDPSYINGLGGNASSTVFPFDGYMAEVHFLNGIAATADDFGELKNGVWVAKPYAGAYDSAAQITAETTNGFYLDFATSGDGTTEDISGNGNNWTENNITASDVVLDSPTDNFCTWNPLASDGAILANGNLDWSTDTSGSDRTYSTIAMSSGKWYWEVTQTDPDRFGTGVVDISNISLPSVTSDIGTSVYEWGFITDGQKRNNSSASSYGSSIGNGGVLMVALDADNGELYFGKDGTWFNSSDPATNTSPAFDTLTSGGEFLVSVSRQTGDNSATFNFGQLGFTYTPPEGYLALSTANLPDPAIDPAQDKEPRDYFETFLYTGNGYGLQVGDVIKKPADTITISSSLLIDHNDGGYLSRPITTSSASPEKTLTISAWVKRSTLGVTFGIVGNYNNLSNNDNLYFKDAGELRYRYESGGTLRNAVETDQAFTDTSVWNHFVFQVDTNGKSGTDAIKIWVNGVLAPYNITNAFSEDENIAHLDDAAEQRVGFYHNLSAQEADGYIAELHYIDGSTYDADTFGEFDANGIWIPKTVTGVTYGTNGFYLDFADNSTADTLGTDQSGNENDFTASVGLDTTDQVSDSPTNNFATLSSAINSGLTLSNGNLDFYSNGSNRDTAVATIAVSSGKWYWEVTADTYAGHLIGVVPENYRPASGSRIGLDDDGIGWRTDISYLYYDGAQQESYGSSLSNGDVVGVALDLDNDTIEWFKNGVSLGSKSFTFTGAYAPAVSDPSNTNQCQGSINFGQRAFAETPPEGYLALSEDNITVDDQNLESPDLVWIKNLDAADKHHMYDSVRGVQKALYPSETDAETDEPNGLLDFNANGFTIGSEVEVNTSGEDYVAWCWKLGGTPTATNTGSIGGVPTLGSIMIDGTPSTTALSGSLLVEKLSANTQSGISVLRYVAGAGVSNGTIDHGLTQAPEFVMCKNLEVGTAQWAMSSDYLTSWAYSMELDNDGSATSVSSRFTSTPPTDTIFNVGTSGYTNSGGDKYQAFCFHSVEGFSKIGSYTGGSDPFVYLGFAPAFVMCKSTGAYHWLMFDNKRSINLNNIAIQADATTAESTAYGGMDFLSNGFKIDSTNAALDSGTIIYMAFAENPFKYSNAR
jgi:hypothetical protein